MAFEHTGSSSPKRSLALRGIGSSYVGLRCARLDLAAVAGAVLAVFPMPRRADDSMNRSLRSVTLAPPAGSSLIRRSSCRGRWAASSPMRRSRSLASIPRSHPVLDHRPLRGLSSLRCVASSWASSAPPPSCSLGIHLVRPAALPHWSVRVLPHRLALPGVASLSCVPPALARRRGLVSEGEHPCRLAATSAHCSTERMQVCCTLLRSWGSSRFACRPPGRGPYSEESGPGSSSGAPRCGLPSTNSPRQ